MNAIIIGLTGFVFLLLVIIFFWLRSQSAQLKLVIEKQQAQELFYLELQSVLEQQESSLNDQVDNYQTSHLELEQVSKQLEHRIKTLQQQVEQNSELIIQLQQQQPEDKLYSRALKLVALGADVEEVMRECDMPRVEVELLFSIHQSNE